ncbi:MAG: TDT family transporter [Candidatus Symbiodolus clandestinus]
MSSTLLLCLWNVPTPLASLALAIASLGSCLERALPLQGYGSSLSAGLASLLLIAVLAKFICYPKLLLQELKHPVAGSILPTGTMAVMVISKAFGHIYPLIASHLWLSAVVVHISLLLGFIAYRVQDFSISMMVPSWFVPPVGIIVSVLTMPNDRFLYLTLMLLKFGIASYLTLLPILCYRLLFFSEIPDNAKPTLAILAAPASLSLAGYLTIVASPSLLLVALLSGIAVLMTVIVYCSFYHLLRLPFTPSYAAFTFPMVIGATALFQLGQQLSCYSVSATEHRLLIRMAKVELLIATLMVAYVCLRYCQHYRRAFVDQRNNKKIESKLYDPTDPAD